jgi:Ice-binding-like
VAVSIREATLAQLSALRTTIARKSPSTFFNAASNGAFAALGVTVLVLAAGLTATVRSAQSTIDLGTADSFAVLAGSTITNTGSTTIRGDVGLHPGTAVTGWSSVTQTGGTLHIADGVASQAKVDLVTAYHDAAGRSPATRIATELGTQLLQAGVYDSASGTFGITGTVTLDGAGDPAAVFIFQMKTTLITATDSSVALINGANACNVFWQVGSSATLGTRTSFAGTVMALASISLGNGVVVDGRTLARNGAVTLIGDTITRSDCPIIQPTAAPTAVPTAIPTVVPTLAPTPIPTLVPTAAPTAVPTAIPTAIPTLVPTAAPTAVPTAIPTAVPTAIPTAVPTAIPTLAPTPIPTLVPTAAPTAVPTAIPTAIPTLVPSVAPSAIPTAAPTAVPVITAAPTVAPTEVAAATATPVPTGEAAAATGIGPVPTLPNTDALPGPSSSEPSMQPLALFAGLILLSLLVIPAARPPRTRIRRR